MNKIYGALVALLVAILAYFYQDAVSNGVKVTVSRKMACSRQSAFQAVTDFDIMPQISADILGYEFEDDPPMHLNMRFSETRRMGANNGDVLVTNLQVVEFDNTEHHARMVADTHGTIWDTTFNVTSATDDSDKESELQLSMHARAHELFPKLLNPIMQILFRYGLNSHMDQVKVWCEKQQEQ